MKTSHRWFNKLGCGFAALTTAAALTGCGSGRIDSDDLPVDDLAAEKSDRTVEILVSENPNKHLPMDFGVASETARESQTFPGAFRIAADALELGRGTTGNVPNIGAQGEAYLEMPHPDGTPLHIRGNRIRSHSGTVTVSGWPVVVRDGKRLVGTSKDTVIKIGPSGVQALGPSIVEDLVSSPTLAADDSLTPLPSIDSSSTPFIPLPPDFFDLDEKPFVPEPEPKILAGGGKRGIIDGKTVGKEPKRGFTGSYEGVDNPKFPGDPSLNKAGDINLSPAEVSTDFGIGNTPPLPTVPGG